MRTAIAVAVMMVAATPAAWGDGLKIFPVSPPDGGVLTVGDEVALAFRTTPGAMCYADVRVVGAARPDHKAAHRADADGMVSWPADRLGMIGTREVTAYCSLNGERAQRSWKYSVE